MQIIFACRKIAKFVKISCTQIFPVTQYVTEVKIIRSTENAALRLHIIMTNSLLGPPPGLRVLAMLEAKSMNTQPIKNLIDPFFLKKKIVHTQNKK